MSGVYLLCMPSWNCKATFAVSGNARQRRRRVRAIKRMGYTVAPLICVWGEGV